MLGTYSCISDIVSEANGCWVCESQRESHFAFGIKGLGSILGKKITRMCYVF